MKTKRVVITGVGLVSPLGESKEVFWANLINQVNAAAEATSFDVSPYPQKKVCEVRTNKFESFFSKAENKLYGRASRFAIYSAHQCLQDAGLYGHPSLQSAAVIVGTTFGEAQIVEKATRSFLNHTALPQAIAQYSPSNLSVNIAKKFHLSGPNFVVPTACAAGNYALSYGAFLIKNNQASLVLAGGADPLSQVGFSGFSRLGVMTDDYCRPFDRNRKGMIVGEGAGMVVLEEYEHALGRGAKIYAELKASGFSCDAKHMTIPDIDGIGAMMAAAIGEAGIHVDEVDYICAHGTGTVLNDKTESAAIRKLFYNAGHKVPVSSIKSMTGHTMGAASAIETIACLLSMQYDRIPPTSNHQTNDPDCDIDCVPNESRGMRMKYVLNNALAFGGTNSSILFARVN